jgi:hypothetical protein
MLRLSALAALLLLALAACGGPPPPATMADIPTYPSATEIEAGANAMADAVAAEMRGAVDAGLSSEVRLFQLPAATSWDEVRAFYGEGLGGADWREAGELSTTNEALSTAGWQRGEGADEQVLMVGFMPALLGEGPVAIVSLFSE